MQDIYIMQYIYIKCRIYTYIYNAGYIYYAGYIYNAGYIYIQQCRIYIYTTQYIFYIKLIFSLQLLLKEFNFFSLQKVSQLYQMSPIMEHWGAVAYNWLSSWRATYSECVFVALGTKHAMRLRHSAICCLSGSTVFFHIS